MKKILFILTLFIGLLVNITIEAIIVHAANETTEMIWLALYPLTSFTIENVNILCKICPPNNHFSKSRIGFLKDCFLSSPIREECLYLRPKEALGVDLDNNVNYALGISFFDYKNENIAIPYSTYILLITPNCNTSVPKNIFANFKAVNCHTVLSHHVKIHIKDIGLVSLNVVDENSGLDNEYSWVTDHFNLKIG